MTWLDYLPWWGNWALMAPLIIAAVMTINLEHQALWRFSFKHVVLMFGAMGVYWALTVLEVSLLNNHGALSVEIVQEAVSHLLLSPMHLDVLVYLAIVSQG